MNTKGVNFQPSKRGQFSAAVDNLDLPPNREEGRRGFLTYEGFHAFESGGRTHTHI
jgi:hypothetical protein